MIDEKRKGFDEFPQKVTFSGPSFDDGSMDVKDFAPFLISLTALYEETYFHLTGEKEAVSIRITADLRKGSFKFIIKAIVFVTDLFIEGLNPKKVLILLFKYLNTIKNPDWEKMISKKDGENTMLSRETEEEEITSTKFLGMLRSKTMKRRTREIFAPFRGKNIEKIAFEDSEDGKRNCELNKNDIKNLSAPDKKEDDDEITSSSQKLMVEIDTVQFNASGERGRKWRFRTDATEEFTALICDNDFLEKMNRKEISFTKGDILKVERETIQKQTKEGLKSEHKIIHVIEIIHVIKQAQGGDEQEPLVYRED